MANIVDDDADAVLSDVEGEDPVAIVIKSPSQGDNSVEEFRELLDRERAAREAAEASKSELQVSFNRLKALAHEAIKKRDECSRQRDEALREKEELVELIKISGKFSNIKNFAAAGLPRSQKYSGLQAVAYGVIKRTNEIVEELVRQIDVTAKSRK
ncbi:hypothetical protein OIU77_014885 [Salix suchowensis]|uniref:Uncharacterized protein n=1 Tax=Salix suchowensis TaxID=1278906 RepID=A0ABQ8ZZF7_9ROSI|nr:hypothetical protein OIU77_014885 [Salix suchowensis]